ncbi:hypothetical protein ElyMa_000248600 [Elysia marginata]|uniref:Uncharacterized protein n=1 Tax=Elysia marginata TaxID=1093978 RepID=A0AAV4F1M2_9GAST|nr:hypothetical protein ElyMa_000248600 [Elysia marginata]
MPGLVDGNDTSSHTPFTTFNSGQVPRRNNTNYRRSTPRYPTSSLSSTRGSRYNSYRGSSFTKRRWLYSSESNTWGSSGQARKNTRIDTEGGTGSRGTMPSEFDQSTEVVNRGAENHFAHMDESDDSNSGSSSLNILVAATSNPNSNLAGMVLVDPSAGSSVDGLVSSYSTDSEDLDDTSSSGAATSLSPASSTSLGSPGSRDAVDTMPSPAFRGKNLSTFCQSSSGSKTLALLEEREKGKENVNKIKTANKSKDETSRSNDVDEKKLGSCDDKSIRANLEDVTLSCSSVYDNMSTGELDENDNCDKPLAHILSQVNSSNADLEKLDNRKYRSKKDSRDDMRNAPLIYTSSNVPNRDAHMQLKSEVCEASLDQALACPADSTSQKSSSDSRLITSEEHQVQLLKRVSTKAKAENKQGRAFGSKNPEVQFVEDPNSFKKSKKSGTNTSSHVDHNSSQGSLYPEPIPGGDATTFADNEVLVCSDSLSIDTSNVVLKRPRSYPQVSQKTLFTPIPPPSPEQSGLYQSEENKSVDSSHVDVPTTTVLTSVTSDLSRASTTATTTTTNSVVAQGASLSEAASTSGKRMKRSQKMNQSNLPVARVNPQANPNVTASVTGNAVPAHAPGGPHQTGDSVHKLPQYSFYPQHHMPHQQHQQQQSTFYHSPQLFPIPPGVYMQEAMGGNTGYFAPGPVPVVFLSEPPGFCDQSYFQDSAPNGYQHYVPQPGSRMPPAMCFPAENQNAFTAPYRPTSDADSMGNSGVAGPTHRGFKANCSTLESSDSINSDKASGHSPAASNSTSSMKGTADQNKQGTTSQFERSEHRASPRNTPTSAKKKPHKQPLLPDPLIPKLSERASQPHTGSADAIPPTMDVQTGMYHHPQQHQHHQYLQPNPCQPPGHQQMLQPHHPFFLQQMAANGANPPVFHGNFIEHMSSSTAAFSAHSPVNGVLLPSPPGAALQLQGQHPTGPGERPLGTPASNSASSTASPAPEGANSAVSFVTDSTGLVIYGPQPPAAHSPAPLCLPILSPDTSTRPSTAPAASNSGVEYHHPQQQAQIPGQEGEDLAGVTAIPAPNLDPEDPAQQPQQQLPLQGGLLYIPDGSGTGYVAVEVSALQAQMDVSGGYPLLSAPQDISYRPQDGQPAPIDSSNNRKFYS